MQVYGLEEVCLVGTDAQISAQLSACQRAAELGLKEGETHTPVAVEGEPEPEAFVAPAPCELCKTP